MKEKESKIQGKNEEYSFKKRKMEQKKSPLA
jgi:hypothetical protein